MEFKPPTPLRYAVGRFGLYGLLCLWAVICVFPLYWLAVTAFKGPAQIDSPPTYLPFVDYAPTLEAWRFILGDRQESLIWRFVHSAEVAVGAGLLAVLTGAMALYGVTRFAPSLRWGSLICAGGAAGLFAMALVIPGLAMAFWLGVAVLAALAVALWQTGPVVGAAGLMGVLLVPRVLPPVVIVLPLYLAMRATGLHDTLVGLMLVYAAINLPVAVWLLQPILGNRVTDQEEAAALDGASHLKIFWGILLPMVRPGLVAVGLLVFLLGWNEYLFAVYLTADHALTLPPWMAGQLSLKEAQIGGEAEEWAHLSAATLVMAFPALIFAVVTQRVFGREAGR